MRKFSRLSSLAALLLVLLSGCGGGSPTDPLNPPPPPPPPPPSGSVTVNVPAGQPATVSTDGLVLRVPAPAFPASASVTFGTAIPLTAPITDEMVNISGKSEITVTCTQVPQDDIVLELPANRSVAGEIVVSGLVDGFWRCLSLASRAGDSPNQIRLDRNAFALNKSIKGVVGRIPISPVDSYCGLVQYGPSNPAKLPLVAVLVHGFNSNAGAMKTLADKLVANGRYGAIYVYHYDWRRRIADSSAVLAQELGNLSRQGLEIEIVAHSMGGLVARHALEKRDATLGVKRIFALFSPNLGSYLATPERAITAIRNEYLNFPSWARRIGTFAMLGVPAIEELIPGSALLGNLNSYDPGHQRGSTDFISIGSSQDLVVGLGSGRADGVPLVRIYAGAVNLVSATGFGHSSIVTSGSHAQTVTDFISTFVQDEYALAFDQQTIDGDAKEAYLSSGWKLQPGVHNASPDTNLIVNDVSLDVFSRYGQWQYCIWLDQTGNTNPELVRLDAVAGPGDDWVTDDWTPIHGNAEHFYLFDCAPENQAKTVVVRIRYRYASGSRAHCTTKIWRCFWDGRYPDSVQIRSRSG